jgi:hypothetical protein
VTRTLNRTFAHPRFAWVLWLALLLPLAQAAANWHGQSHWDAERSGSSGGKDALVALHCGVCLSAAAVSGGGATSTPLVIAHAPPRQHSAPSAAPSLWSAPILAAYQSRAPPSSLR